MKEESSAYNSLQLKHVTKTFIQQLRTCEQLQICDNNEFALRDTPWQKT